jgi:hypothetical protein
MLPHILSEKQKSNSNYSYQGIAEAATPTTAAAAAATHAEMAMNTANSIANMQMMGMASRNNQTTQTLGQIVGGTAEAQNKAVGAMGNSVK